MNPVKFLERLIEAATFGHDPSPIVAVTIAQSFADQGVRESDGQNRGPVVDAIHELSEAAGGSGDKEDAAAWCARFVNVCWYLGGLATGQKVDPDVSRSGSVFYLMHSTHNRAPELVTRVDSDEAIAALGDVTKAIRPGDALIRYEMRPEHAGVSFKDRKRRQTHKGHTEIVVRVYDNGDLDTIGGNTDHDTAREGNGVFFHSKRYSIHEDRVVGFVRPRFVPWNDALADTQ